MEKLGILISEVIEEAMVRNQNHKQIIPHWQGAQTVHKHLYAMVGKGKGIELLVLQTMIGNLKGFVTGEGLEGHMPGLRHLSAGYHLEGTTGRHTVIGSPFALINLRQRKVGITDQLAVTSAHQITLGVHERNVATV